MAKNQEISAIFDSMAAMMELLNEDPFRINSYRNAARALADLGQDIEQIIAGGWKPKIGGIGTSMAAKIEEYCRTGHMAKYDELRAKLPEHLPELLRLGGLGPKTVAKLWHEAGITSIEELRQCLETCPDRIVAIKGMGEKKVQQMAEALAFVQTAGGRTRLGDVATVVGRFVEQISRCKGASRVTAAGSYRRGRETVGDIDLLCIASKADAPGIIEQFAASPLVGRVLARGDTKGSVLLRGELQADLRVVDKGSFGAALVYFTGSKAHNIVLRSRAIERGLKLNEYGLFRGEESVGGDSEEAIYAALGLPWIAPELREDRGEVAAAEAGALPALVELADIRGDFHMHTTASDGVHDLREMVAACRRLGYRAMAVCDHSKGQVIAHGLDEDRLREQVRQVRELAGEYKDMLVLAGCEVDIGRDGRLDFDDDVLAELDFVMASPHSALGSHGGEATERIIQAIEHPLVNCIGHPTGRVINSRPGMEMDMGAICEAAAARGVALEINADFARLDLRDNDVRTAVTKGTKLMINTDAHSTDNLQAMMPYGVLTARRGWATKADVVNTWPAKRVKEWLNKGR